MVPAVAARSHRPSRRHRRPRSVAHRVPAPPPGRRAPPGARPSGSGSRTRRIQVGAYLAAACSSAIAGVPWPAQVGIGDATVGGNYTLLAIATRRCSAAPACLGGRGMLRGCVCVLALALTQTLPQILGISDAMGYLFTGLLTMACPARLLVPPPPACATRPRVAPRETERLHVPDRPDDRARRTGPGARGARARRAVGPRAPAHPHRPRARPAPGLRRRRLRPMYQRLLDPSSP